MIPERDQTAEWHAWRRKGVGSSDAPIIMGVSPWQTPYGLWEEKTNRAERRPMNYAMIRGHELEPIARRLYEERTDRLVEPVNLIHPEHGWMKASLDGRDFDGGRILELKCPGQEDHAHAAAGRVPAKYIPQVQHLLCVSGATVCDYVSYDGSELVIIEVPRDEDYIGTLIAAEADFWRCVTTDTPPPLTDRDVVTRADATFLEAARLYREADAGYVEWLRKREAAKELLVSLAGETVRSAGGGVKVTKVPVKGRVDYAKIPELIGVDLDEYRKAGHVEWRVTVEK